MGAGARLWGVDGIEEVGLRRGVVAPTGVAVLEGSTCNRGHFCSHIPHADWSYDRNNCKIISSNYQEK